MSDERSGNICRLDDSSRNQSSRGQRAGANRGLKRILVVDPVLGSRVSLAQALAQPGIIVDIAANPTDAHQKLSAGDIALVVADQDMAEVDGVDFLAQLRGAYPHIPRALVTAEEDFEYLSTAYDRAGLSFLISRQWQSHSLRRTVREFFDGLRSEKVDAARGTQIERSRDHWQVIPAGHDSLMHREVLLRGLLAGLNSCERTSEVFTLLRNELSDTFRVREWIWFDETQGEVVTLSGEGGLPQRLDRASRSELDRSLLEELNSLPRAGRIGRSKAVSRQGQGESRTAVLGLQIRFEDRLIQSCLVHVEVSRATMLLELLRGLELGLGMAIRRLHQASVRAEAARDLAHRVSRELRLPVGELRSAVARLRGEAQRAGLSAECVERIDSESQRVTEAVETLEGEVLYDDSGFAPASH